jgi:hypothetical protein
VGCQCCGLPEFVAQLGWGLWFIAVIAAMGCVFVVIDLLSSRINLCIAITNFTFVARSVLAFIDNSILIGSQILARITYVGGMWCT